MNITTCLLERINKKYGESFYILDSDKFERNYKELQKAFRDIYPNSHIAYSYKTNYTPELCKIVNENGGMAEVVSDMEYQIARKIGVKPYNIVFNGPYKRYKAVEELLLDGGIVNIDSNYELEMIKEIAYNNRNKQLTVGIRCNFDVNDGVVSRFGFDVNGEDFINAIRDIRDIKNLNLIGLHCHFAARNIENWPARVEGMLKLVEKYFIELPTFITLGGGLFGKMHESLKAQFEQKIPSYQEYAEVAAGRFKEFFKNIDASKQPKLIIEPGSALVGDAMKFVAKVINIKDVRGKKIATLSGSIYNINPTLNKKNPPITIYHSENNLNKQQEYTNLDFGGYTCIESDYLYRSFKGSLAVGDYIVFDNVGSYSVVLKPPFILPNFAMVEYNEKTDYIKLIKEKETFDDIFKTFKF